ncbi:M20 family metallo-hydrolase [Elioraea sp. Yellowstone]|jgi:N-carbamoyl-L-amino-acid hydrolase|uniref:M20 family metallo-hydrolase n=1 Tax=Elioraea sp. Yellowstone TaxID=2592070 RepID=UPI001F159BCE|nr:M20 family metallo-hydrolase [Elioraea sp. Yellowstone]
MARIGQADAGRPVGKGARMVHGPAEDRGVGDRRMAGGAAADAVAAVSEGRLWDRLMAMARIGGFTTEEGHEGVNRPCLTPLDREARRLLIGWAQAAGASVSVDPAANLFLRWEGTDPSLAPVLTGSHMDTQPQGGRFDGIYGVLAGLEAIEALAASGVRPRRPVEVVAWTNEEGGRFAPGCTGSMSFAGFKPMSAFDDIVDAEGVRYADALAAQLAEEADLPRRPLGYVPHAYVEAHIEQGPRLEAEGQDIGVVTGIQGSRWFTVTVEGRTDHAGTTPLSLRKDAVQDALRAIAALNALMHDPTDVLRFTVGSIAVEPGTSNSVARRVVFTIDFRHPDEAVLRPRGDAIAGVVQAALKACTARVHERFTAWPADFGPTVPEAVARAAASQGLKAIRLPSGAFHDAQFLVPVCPTGMIFIPCRGGVSHHPSEYAEPRACANGARVLTEAVLELAGGP